MREHAKSLARRMNGSPLAVSSVVVSVSRVLGALANLATLLAIEGIWGSFQLGVFVTLTLWPTMIVVLASLGTFKSVSVLVAEIDHSTAKSLGTSLVIMTAGASVVGFLCSLVVLSWFTDISMGTRVSAASLVLPLIANQYAVAWAGGAKRFKLQDSLRFYCGVLACWR